MKEDADDHVKEEKLKGTARKYADVGKVDEDEDDDEENTDDLETEDDEENDEEGKENNEANDVRVGAGKRAEGNLVVNHGRQPLRT